MVKVRKTKSKAALNKRKGLTRYAGEWVAFAGDRVVGHGTTLKGLMARVAVKKLGRKASVFLVPRKDEGPYVLIVLPR